MTDATGDTTQKDTTDATRAPPDATTGAPPDATDATRAPPDAGSGYIAFYRDHDAILYRERQGWPGEVLNGTKWQYCPIDMADMRQQTEDQARALARGTPLDGPNQGISAASGYDTGEGDQSATADTSGASSAGEGEAGDQGT